MSEILKMCEEMMEDIEMVSDPNVLVTKDILRDFALSYLDRNSWAVQTYQGAFIGHVEKMMIDKFNHFMITPASQYFCNVGGVLNRDKVIARRVTIPLWDAWAFEADPDHDILYRIESGKSGEVVIRYGTTKHPIFL